jgi:hypothetical protein
MAMNNIDIEKESLLSDNDILDIVLDAEQQMVEALEDTISGLVNPLIIKGPPGVGKTEAIKIATNQAGIVSTDFLSSSWSKPTEKEDPPYPHNLDQLVTVNGALIRGSDYAKWSLAVDLYANRDQGILCLDDNDSILKDVDAVSMLMQATEQSVTRTVKYPKANSTHEVQIYGVAPVFQVKTPIIILTNMDMKLKIEVADHESKNEKKPKIKPGYISRWEALVSRGTYIDLKMNSPRSVRVFCEHKINKVKMLTQSAYLTSKYGRCLTKKEADDCMKWVRHNQGKLASPLDLRTYNKVAGIMLNRSKTWEQSAKVRFLKAV